MESLNPQVVAAAKLPILNPNKFDLWKMRIEQYFLMIDYSLWEVILNGDSSSPTRIVDGAVQIIAPTTAKQRLAKKNELKARETLLMALPDKHQLKFNIHKDAKSLMEAIEKRVGEILGETISQEDINLKFLRSLPSEWKTHTLIWRNKADLEEQSLDDLFNNLKIYEAEVEGSSTSSQNTQNIAFMSSNNTDSTNELVSAVPVFLLLVLRLQFLLFQIIVDGAVQIIAPTTVKQRLAKKNELKARETLLMALPDKHQLKFNIHKDAKSLPSEWKTHTLIWRNKADLEEQSLDDLFNNLKIYEAEVKGSYTSSQNTQNIAFMSFNNTDSTNELVSAVPSVSVASSKATVSTLPNVDSLSDAVIYSFFASQSNKPQLDNEDSKQIDPDDLDEMDLKECRSPRDNRNKEAARRPVPTKVFTLNALVSQCDAVGGYDWSFQADEEPTNYALMAFSSSGSSKLHSHESDNSAPKNPENDRYKTGEGYHDVPPPYTKTFIPPKPDLVFNDAPNASESIANVFNKEPSFALTSKHVKTLRESVKNVEHPKQAKTLRTNNKKSRGKGKIKTGKLDFDDVYFMKELKFNLFSVLQMCDKKNSVLFTYTECVILSSDYKLFDENHVLLRVLRENSMYNVDLKNVVPLGDLTYLFVKIYESNLWHRRLGHINFKTMNKLVKGNVVREKENVVHVSTSGSDKTDNKKQDEKSQRDAKRKSLIDSSAGVRDLRAKFEAFSTNSTNRVNAVSAPVTAAKPNPTNSTNSFNTASPSINAGHTQEEGIDYDEVFAPVERIEAIWLFLAYASFMGFMVYHMDVKSDFLYGTIEEEVYVCKPSGFEDLDYPDKVYKVVKAFYGLHQAPRAWYETLANYLLENGFQRGKID
nr:putative ribonuclease H-like domain-containing protein [Tanacetum cinerariifolium]